MRESSLISLVAKLETRTRPGWCLRPQMDLCIRVNARNPNLTWTWTWIFNLVFNLNLKFLLQVWLEPSLLHLKWCNSKLTWTWIINFGFDPSLPDLNPKLSGRSGSFRVAQKILAVLAENFWFTWTGPDILDNFGFRTGSGQTLG